MHSHTAAFKRVSLAERLESFENEVNEVDSVKKVVMVETVSLLNSGEVILAQLFHFIEKTMAKIITIFDKIDTDGSGSLDKDEFRRAVTAMGFEVPGIVAETLRKPESYEIDAAFDVLDADHGGSVDIEEFLAAMKVQRKQAAQDALDRLQRGESLHGTSELEAHTLNLEQLSEVHRTISLAGGSGASWLPSEKVVRTLANWLWQVELFSFMKPEVRRKFCVNCDVQCLEAGETVLRMGDASGGISILFEGSCAIYLPHSQNINSLDSKAGVRQQVSERENGSRVANALAAAIGIKREAPSAEAVGLAVKSAANKWKKNKSAGSGHPHHHHHGVSISHDHNALVHESPARPMVRSMDRRGGQDLGSGSQTMVEIVFGPTEVFGEARAFHNINSAKVKAQGLMTVSATVKALEASQLITIKQPELVVALEQAYLDLQAYKINFLKRIPHYKYCSDKSLDLLARNLRRKIYPAREVVALEGEEADTAYFIISGKMQVEQGGQPVAVLGPANCFGDWGVINRKSRAASLSCVTECEVLVIHAYNFIRTVDKRVIEALKQKQQMVKAGKSMASATQMVDDQMRKSVSSSNFQILRKQMPPQFPSPDSIHKTDPQRIRNGTDPQRIRKTDPESGDESPPQSPHALDSGTTGKQKAKATTMIGSESLALDPDQPLRRMGNGTISHYRSVAGAGRVTSQATSESGSGSGTSEPQSARARLEGRESSLRAAMAATAMAARKSKSSRGKRERAVPLPVPPSTSSPRSRSTKGSSRQHQPQFGSTRKEKVGVQYKLPLPPLKIKVASPRYRQVMMTTGPPHVLNTRERNRTQGQGYFEPSESFRQRSPRHGSRRGGGGGGLGRGGGGTGGGDLHDCLSRIRSNPRAFAVVQ